MSPTASSGSPCLKLNSSLTVSLTSLLLLSVTSAVPHSKPAHALGLMRVTSSPSSPHALPLFLCGGCALRHGKLSLVSRLLIFRASSGSASFATSVLITPVHDDYFLLRILSGLDCIAPTTHNALFFSFLWPEFLHIHQRPGGWDPASPCTLSSRVSPSLKPSWCSQAQDHSSSWVTTAPLPLAAGVPIPSCGSDLYHSVSSSRTRVSAGCLSGRDYVS